MFREKRFFIRFLSKLTIPILIPVIIMTVYMQNVVYKNLAKNTRELSESYFFTTSDYIEDVIDNAFASAIYLAADQQVLRILRLQKEKDIYSVDYLRTQYSVKQQLKTLMETNNIIHSIYIYNQDSGDILISDGVLTRIERHYDTGWLNYYEDCIAASTVSILPERISWSEDYPMYMSNKAQAVISVALPIKAQVGANCTGMIIVNIAKNELFNVNKADNFSFLVYQDNKNVITSYKGAKMDEAAFDEVIKHQSLDNSVVQLSPTDSREQYNVYYKELPKFNIVYSIINSMGHVHSMLQNIQIAVLSILIGSILLCMLIAVQIARKYCTPIMTISRDLQEFVPLGEKEDYLRYITGAVASISSKYREMSHMDPNLIGNLFNTAMIDEPSLEVFYFCAVISIDNYHSIAAQKSIAEIHDIKKELISYTQQKNHEDTVCEGVMLDNDKILLAFKVKRFLSTDDVQELLHGIMKDSKMGVSAGIGGQYEKRSDLTQSYLEALDAVKYRLVLGRQCVALYDELIIGRGEVKIQPPKVSELISKMNHKDICTLLCTYFASLKKTVLVDSNTLFEYVLPIISDLSHFLTNNGISIDSVLDKGRPVYVLLLSQETFDDICELLCDICQSVFELLTYQKDDEAYMHEISDIIDSRYSDSQLDINAIAEKVGISYSYVCKIVKDRTKLSFTNYLNRYRIGKAKQLLEQTDFSVRQVAEVVGYVNDQSLTRYFKKFEGITPGKYRKLHGAVKMKQD